MSMNLKDYAFPVDMPRTTRENMLKQLEQELLKDAPQPEDAD